MARLRISRTLVVRIEQFGLGKELRAFAAAVTNNQHPPRVYKASGVDPVFAPYQMLGLHHHHLHRDGDPLLITQHIEREIYAVALATHEIYFRGDKMEWLKQNMEAIDWTEYPSLKSKVSDYSEFGFGNEPDEPF